MRFFFFFRLLLTRSDLKRENKVSFVSRDRRVKWHIFCLRIIIMSIKRKTEGFWLVIYYITTDDWSSDLRICDDCDALKLYVLLQTKLEEYFSFFLPLTNNFIYFIFKLLQARTFASRRMLGIIYERIEETERLIHTYTIFIALIQA